uniref:Uncharacterized protein n=1 Tax=Plectus sambesii TaxID=2011161 RepID=A0A914VW68_9BILA
MRREDSSQSGRSSGGLSRTNSLVSECKDLCHESLCTASTSSLPNAVGMRTSSSEQRFTKALSFGDSSAQSPTSVEAFRFAFPLEYSASAPTSPANAGQSFFFPSHVNNLFRSILHKQHLAAQEAEYPQYGVIGPSKEKKNKRQNGDESMAYKAQLHHYQQTKQKIISGEETGVTGARHESDDSGDDADDGE